MSPVACVATIVWEMMVSSATTGKLSADHAGLLLGSILSDTLKFSSPTTTQRDRDAASALAEIAGVNVDELAEKMFAAKSDLTGMSAQDIILMDSKAAEFAGKKVRVSVLETVKPENALAMKDELITEIGKLKSEQGLAHLPLFIVDIMSTASTVIMADEADKELIEKAFGVEVSVDTVNLPGVVSRKKQMLPNLEKALTNAN
jgi:manganese-dependent inorganic pyrophosphatase